MVYGKWHVASWHDFGWGGDLRGEGGKITDWRGNGASVRSWLAVQCCRCNMLFRQWDGWLPYLVPQTSFMDR